MDKKKILYIGNSVNIFNNDDGYWKRENCSLIQKLKNIDNIKATDNGEIYISMFLT